MDTKTFIGILAQKLGRENEDVELLVRSLSEILADSVKQGDSSFYRQKNSCAA